MNRAMSEIPRTHLFHKRRYLVQKRRSLERQRGLTREGSPCQDITSRARPFLEPARRTSVVFQCRSTGCRAPRKSEREERNEHLCSSPAPGCKISQFLERSQLKNKRTDRSRLSVNIVIENIFLLLSQLMCPV